ncbi:MAG: hypothetical protein KDA22_03925 [Phycisphaerales bacterium]|nr:hypothetical protein [Phycisphaerales bacterium]
MTPPSPEAPTAPIAPPAPVENAVVAADGPTAVAPAPRWPRVILTPDAEVVLHFPQIDSWEGDRFKARMAAEVSPLAGGQTFAGALWITARVAADLATQEATVYDMRVAGTRFPGEGRMADRVRRIVTDAIAHRAMPANLQALLAAVTAETVVRVPGAALGDDAPQIDVRRAPAILLQVAGAPVLEALAGTGLEHVRNANQPLFRDGTGNWKLLAGDRWISAPALDGPWSATAVPAGVDKLPEATFAAVRASIGGPPSPLTDPATVPAVVFADRPAELVVVEGEPRYERIGALPLERLTNAASDLFRTDDGSVYLLVAGRWYVAPALEGPWTGVGGADLPSVFREIAPDAPEGGVLASIPGTRAANEALVLSLVPQLLAFDRARATIDVQYDGEPRFAAIDGTAMSMAVNTTFAVVRIGHTCYCCYEGGWFEASDPHGPWRIAQSVPAPIAALPPSSPLYPTTFVRLYDTDANTLVYGWTGGYFGSYASGGTVVYGTGFWNGGVPGWWWAQPATWGCGAWYSPGTGRFMRAQGWIGPYGLGLDPVWHDQTAGWQGWGHQGRNPGAEWPSTMAIGGNVWLRQTWGARRRRDTGNVVVATPTGDSAAGSESGSMGDLYVGNDDNLYRRQDGAWQRYRRTGETGVWEALAPTATDRNWQALVAAADARSEGPRRAEAWQRQWAPPIVVRPGPAFAPMATPLRLAPGWGTIHGRSAIVGPGR